MSNLQAQLIDWSYAIDPATGRCSVNGLELETRDSVFLGYWLIGRGEAAQAEPIIRRLYGEAASGYSALEAAFMLWVAGEYMHATGSRAFVDGDGTAGIELALDTLECSWKQPAPHWLDRQENGLLLSNLAVYYAGIQKIQPYADSGRTQRMLKSIRELLFASFIKDGHVISRLGDLTVHGDITVTAIPFGLLGIEDRILIEALAPVEQLTGRGVRLSAADSYYGGCERSDLTALLAWYYAKKGDSSRAKNLLAAVEQTYRESGCLKEATVSTAKEELLLRYWQETEGGTAPESPLSYLLFELASDSL
ncbi:hypothetical protein, partial [Gorillibacterium massiliense]|uniref:hypothetical protein n=1 Tax=Gorillibacterium massiliense TaxID=1280390 RepID=UPI0005939902